MSSPSLRLGLASFAALAAASMIATSLARAQPMSARAVLPPRVGLELGGGLQAGNLFCESADATKCNGTTAAGGFNLDVAYFFSPTFAVAGDLWAMAHTENNFTISQEIGTVGIKWRPVPILTFQAGVGNAHAAVSYGGAFTARTDDAPGIMGGAALDVLRGRRWALAIEVRAGTGFYGDKNNDGKADTTARNTGIGAELTFFDF